MTRCAQVVLELREPLALGGHEALHGDARPLRHDLRDVVGLDLLLEELLHLLQLGEALRQLLHLGLGARKLAVADLGGPVQVARARRAVGLEAQLVRALTQLLDLADHVLLGLPLRLHALALLAQLGQLGLDVLAVLDGRAVGLLLQRLPLDLELRDAPLEDVDLLGQRVDLDAQPARRLVDQVDRLVREEAAADVAVRQLGRRDHRFVGDAHAVVHLVALLQAAQDRHRVLDRGRRHVHGLEATLQRRVLLDVLAVLVERGRAHDAQLAARERGLEHVARVHGALCRARARRWCASRR